MYQSNPSDCFNWPLNNKFIQLQQRQFSFSKNFYFNKTVSQTTLTVSLISTTTVTTVSYCAQFINVVTGGCRRRRRRQISENVEPTKVHR